MGNEVSESRTVHEFPIRSTRIINTTRFIQAAQQGRSNALLPSQVIARERARELQTYAPSDVLLMQAGRKVWSEAPFWRYVIASALSIVALAYGAWVLLESSPL